MPPAVALRNENALETPVAVASRGEVLARYRHLRAISKRHHSRVMDFLSPGAMLQQARRLGLAVGKTLVLDRMDEMTLAYDLAIHTAPSGRSRAIDRYARAALFAPASDEALVLQAMCKARFSLFCVERRHEAVGVIVKDLLRKGEVWLVDEGLESSVPNGSVMATRLYAPEGFSMTAGVTVPVDEELILRLWDEVPQLARKTPGEVAEDRRFPEAIYRIAVEDGLMADVVYRDVADE